MIRLSEDRLLKLIGECFHQGLLAGSTIMYNSTNSEMTKQDIVKFTSQSLNKLIAQIMLQMAKLTKAD